MHPARSPACHVRKAGPTGVGSGTALGGSVGQDPELVRRDVVVRDLRQSGVLAVCVDVPDEAVDELRLAPQRSAVSGRTGSAIHQCSSGGTVLQLTGLQGDAMVRLPLNSVDVAGPATCSGHGAPISSPPPSGPWWWPRLHGRRISEGSADTPVAAETPPGAQGQGGLGAPAPVRAEQTAVEKTAADLGLLAQLTSAANDSDIPERLQELLSPSRPDEPDGPDELDGLDGPVSTDAFAGAPGHRSAADHLSDLFDAIIKEQNRYETAEEALRRFAPPEPEDDAAWNARRRATGPARGQGTPRARFRFRPRTARTASSPPARRRSPGA